MRSNPSLPNAVSAGLLAAALPFGGEALANESSPVDFVRNDLGEDVFEISGTDTQVGTFNNVAGVSFDVAIKMPEYFDGCEEDNVRAAYKEFDCAVHVGTSGIPGVRESTACRFYSLSADVLGKDSDGDVIIRFNGADGLGHGGCFEVSEYWNVFEYGDDKVYSVLIGFERAEGEMGEGEFDCASVPELVVVRNLEMADDPIFGVPVVDEPESVELAPEVESPVLPVQPPAEIVDPLVVEKERNASGFRVVGDAGYLRESALYPLYQGGAVGLGMSYDLGRLQAGFIGNVVMTGRDGIQNTHFDRAGVELGYELGGERFAVIPALNGGATYDYGVLGTAWFAGAGLDAVIGFEPLRDKNLALVASLDAYVDRNRPEYPWLWDAAEPTLRAGLGVQWRYDMNSVLSGADYVVDAPAEEEVFTAALEEVPMFEGLPVLDGVEYFDFEDIDYPDYVNVESDAERVLNKKEKAMHGDFVMHFGEMNRLASRNAWNGVEDRYQAVKGLNMELLWEVVDRDDLFTYYYLGAQSVRRIGDAQEVYERLQMALLIQPENKEIQNWIADLEKTYFVVSFEGESVRPNARPFAPDANYAVDYSAGLVEEDGEFEGMLPGFYTEFTHYIVTNKAGEEFALLPPGAEQESD